MGSCQSNKQLKSSRPSKPIQINCPICEEIYDTWERKPYRICSNSHTICLKCFSSMKKHASLKKKGKELKCPYCKQVCSEDLLETDRGIYEFLKKEQDVMKKLPDNRKKLYAFSSIYLPSLNNLIKEGGPLNKVVSLRIKGKMLEEYQIFQMQMLGCLPFLRKLELNKNQIRAIDTSGYDLQQLQILSLNNNNIESINALINQTTYCFKYLRYLSLRKNKIHDLGNMRKLNELQTLNLSYNNIQQMNGLINMENLEYLSIQFNNIKKFTNSPQFLRLHTLQLFGNLLDMSSANLIASLPWPRLRFLSLSYEYPNELSRSQFVKTLLKNEWPYIQAIITETQLQNKEKIVQFSSQKLGQGYLIELQSKNYQFYRDNLDSSLTQTILMAKKYHRLGYTMNFQATLNQQHYSLNQMTGYYTKKTSSLNYLAFLYGRKKLAYTCSGVEKNIHYSFRVKEFQKLILGICQNVDSPVRNQLDFSTGIVMGRGENEQTVSNYEEELKKATKSGLREGIWEVAIRIDWPYGTVSWYINETIIALSPLKIETGGGGYIYLGLKEINSSIYVCRNDFQ